MGDTDVRNALIAWRLAVGEAEAREPLSRARRRAERRAEACRRAYQEAVMRAVGRIGELEGVPAQVSEQHDIGHRIAELRRLDRALTLDGKR